MILEILKLQIEFSLAPAIWSKSLSKSTRAGTGAGAGLAGRGAVAGAERAGVGSGSLVDAVSSTPLTYFLPLKYKALIKERGYSIG